MDSEAFMEKNCLADETITALSELYKVFGDRTRIRILYTLLSEKELSVSEISCRLDMSQSAISHQLQILKQSHLVKFRRDGRVLYYSLADSHVETILSMGVEHGQE